MKKLIIVLGVLVILFVGCSKFENNITEPEFFALPKTSESINNTYEGSLTEKVLVSKEIDGAIGGQITILQDVTDSVGRVINISADLIVPAGAYQGIKTISMNVDWKTTSVDFNPSMQFDSPLTFNFIFTNLPLEQMGFAHGDEVQFLYIAPDGTTQPTLSKDVAMNYYFGRLRVNNAKIQHFSRYGFIRRCEAPVQNNLYKTILTQ